MMLKQDHYYFYEIEHECKNPYYFKVLHVHNSLSGVKYKVRCLDHTRKGKEIVLSSVDIDYIYLNYKMRQLSDNEVKALIVKDSLKYD